MQDERAMARALEVGEQGRRTAPPNPWVGCVIVRDGDVVGEGFHERPGEPHAEVAALASAGDRAGGATAFVTLEPCSHHGRTPPCADALIDAGIGRVVVALEDPDPQVAGRGLTRLREAGIDVAVGEGAAAAARSLAPYLQHRRTGRAYCVLKTAMSFDGRVADADGSSRWITGPRARADAHELRADSQAVIVGAGTATTDRPELTARDIAMPVHHQPLRVLLDARGRVPAEGPLFDTTLAPTLVVTTERADPAAVDAWRAAGAKVETVAPAADGTGVDLASTLELLAAHGVLQAMVEGGPTLHGALVAAGLVDRVVAYVAPTVLGTDAVPMLSWRGSGQLATAPRWTLVSVSSLGDDVRLEYEVGA